MNSKIAPWSKPGAGRSRDLDMAVVDQTPRKTSRRDARIGLALPHRQRRTVRVGNRIDERADEALLRQLLDVAVAEQPGGLGDELLPHHTGDAGDGGKLRSQAIGTGRHITLPATPHQREAAAHQEAVAAVLGGSTVRRAVEPTREDPQKVAKFYIDNFGATVKREIPALGQRLRLNGRDRLVDGDAIAK